jgi:hypothetical protein
MIFGVGNASLGNPIRDALMERRVSMNGHPFWVWRTRMPRIPDIILECVVFLYPKLSDAEVGENYGGTGFLVTTRSSKNKNYFYSYVITNRHIVFGGSEGQAAPVVRVKKSGGGFDFLPLGTKDWVCHPDGDDLAACLLDESFGGPHAKILVCGPNDILNPDLVKAWNIGPGDDTFMVSRFINRSGKQTGAVVARSGIISMMPGEKIPFPDGHQQECF